MYCLTHLLRVSALTLVAFPASATMFVSLAGVQSKLSDPMLSGFEVSFQLESGRLTTLPYLELNWRRRVEPATVPRALSLRAAPPVEPVLVSHRGRRRRRSKI